MKKEAKMVELTDNVAVFTYGDVPGPYPLPRALLEDPIAALESGAVMIDDGRTGEVHVTWKDGYARMTVVQLLAALSAAEASDRECLVWLHEQVLRVWCKREPPVRDAHNNAQSAYAMTMLNRLLAK